MTLHRIRNTANLMRHLLFVGVLVNGLATAADAQLSDLFSALTGNQTPTNGIPIGSKTPEEVKRHLRDKVAAFDVTVNGQPAEWKSTPLMDWQNTTRMSERGLFYIWAIGDRPAVLGSVFSFELFGTVRTKTELIALVPDVEIRVGDRTLWKPDGAVPRFRSVPDTQPPAASPARRKLQIAAIAKRFAARHVDPRGGTTELRMMEKPIHRYRSPADDIMDGVIFPMVISTDPEVFLIIEARMTDDGPAWFYAPVPSHYHELRVSLDDEPVWTSPLRMQFENMNEGEAEAISSPHTSFAPIGGF